MQFQKTALTIFAAAAFAAAAAVPVAQTEAPVYGDLSAPAQVAEVASELAPSVEEVVADLEAPIEEAAEFAPVSGTAYTQAPLEEAEDIETEVPAVVEEIVSEIPAVVEEIESEVPTVVSEIESVVPTFASQIETEVPVVSQIETEAPVVSSAVESAAPVVSSETVPSIEDVEDLEVPETVSAPISSGASSITYEQVEAPIASGSSISYEQLLGEEDPAFYVDEATFDNGVPVTYSQENLPYDLEEELIPTAPVVSGGFAPASEFEVAPIAEGIFPPSYVAEAVPTGVFPPSYVAEAAPTGVFPPSYVAEAAPTGVSSPVEDDLILIDTQAPSAGIDYPVQAIIDGEEFGDEFDDGTLANAYYQAALGDEQTLPTEGAEYPLQTLQLDNNEYPVPTFSYDDESIFADDEEMAEAYARYAELLENEDDLSGTVTGSSLAAPLSSGTVGIEHPKVFYVRNGRPYFPQPTPYLPVPLHSNYAVNTSAFDPSVPLTEPTISKDTVLDPNEFDGEDVTEDELLSYIAPFTNSTGVAGNSTAAKGPEYYIPREVMRSMKLKVIEALDSVLGHY